MGPSRFSFDEITPIDISPLIDLLFPSRLRMSITDETLPPYFAEKHPLISLISFIALLLKALKSHTSDLHYTLVYHPT